MAGLFGQGSNSSLAGQQNDYTGIPVNQSAYGVPIPIVFGAARIGGTLLDYTNFITNIPSQPSGGGGSGGGGGNGKGPSAPGSITYTADIVIGVCEGPIINWGNVWQSNQMTPLASAGITIAFLGGIGQADWAYWQTAYPSHYSNYSGIAYLGGQTFMLGSGAQLPNFGFEIFGFRYGSAPNGIDADPSLVVQDLATNAIWGCNFPASRIGTLVNNSEAHAVPGSPFQVTVTNAASFQWNLDVTIGGVPLVCVAASPASGQYSFNAATGVYTFNTAQSGQTATFNYVSLKGLTDYQNFTLANGLWISPTYTTSEPCTTLLERIAEETYANWVWSSGVATLVPRGSEAITANGYTYTPPAQALFDLGDKDFMLNRNPTGAAGAGSNDDPVILTRLRAADQLNDFKAEALDRNNQYAPSVVQLVDQARVDQFGRRPSPSGQMHDFCDLTAAQTSVQFQMQDQYIRNRYSFQLDQRYILLDPMDIVTLTDANLGMNKQWVRIIEISENDDGSISCLAEEYPIGRGKKAAYTLNSGSGIYLNYNEVPGAVNQPYVFALPTARAKNQGLALGIAASGSVPSTFGGSQLWASTAGATYALASAKHIAARMGTLTADYPAGSDPDTADTLSVDLGISAGALLTASQADADAARSLCWVGTVPFAASGVGANLTLTSGKTVAITGTPNWNSAVGAVAVNNGRWYWEVTINSFTASNSRNSIAIGLARSNQSLTAQIGATAGVLSYGWQSSVSNPGGKFWATGVSSDFGVNFVQGDVIGVVWDAGKGSLTYYRNGVYAGVAAAKGVKGTLAPAVSLFRSSGADACQVTVNLGPQNFIYGPPTDFAPYGQNGEEFISFTTAALVSGHQYNLTNYIRRGQYSTPAVVHPAGSPFVRIDVAIAQYSYQATDLGSTVKFKLPAFNSFGGGLENLSSAVAYSVTIPQPPRPPNVPSLAAAQSGNVVVFSWGQLPNYSLLALAGIYIGYAPPGTTNWNDFTLLTEAQGGHGTEMTNAEVPPGTWIFGARAASVAHVPGSNWGLSPDISYANGGASMTVTNQNTAISNVQEAPDWLGPASGFVRHQGAGMLLPASTDAIPVQLSLPGVAGNYATTPHAAANAFTGDLDVRWFGVLPVFPTATGLLIGKWTTIAGNRVWEMFISAASSLSLAISADGATSLGSVTSGSNLAAISSPGQFIGLRITRVKSSGVVTFWTSFDDGQTWAPFGNTATLGVGTAMYGAGNSAVTIGAINTGTAQILSAAMVQRAEVYDGINGKLACRFAPNVDGVRGGTTVVSGATGETWSIVASGMPAAALVGAGKLNGLTAFVPYPIAAVLSPYYPLYQARRQVDLGFSGSVRVWETIAAALGPGVVLGSASPTGLLETTDVSGSYGTGFGPWSIGTVNSRYYTAGVTLDPAVGNSEISSLLVTADAPQAAAQLTGVVIAGGGTTVTFPQQYHTAPSVVATPVSGSGLNATVASVTTTQCVVHVWNGGSDVGGTVNIVITGS